MKKHLLISAAFVMCAAFLQVQGRDLSSYITITNFSILDAEDNAIPLDKGDDPANYAFGLANGEIAEIKFSWSISTGTYLLQDGDFVNLSINPGNFTYYNFSSTPIYDGGNNKLGTISKTGGTISIIFSDNAVGHNELSGIFSSGHVIRRANGSTQDEVRIFKFNGINYKYLAEKSPLTPKSTDIARKSSASGNTSSRNLWGFQMFRRIERYLSDPAYEANRQDINWVNQNMRFNDVYIEDSIAEVGVDDVTINNIRAIVSFPISSEDPTSAAMLTDGVSQSIMTFFTLVTPLAGESREDFRARVKSVPLQYGVYKDGDIYTVMIFLGDWPNSSITFQNTGCEANVSNVTHTEWTDERKQLWLQMHSTDNILGGAVTELQIDILVNYTSPVVAETPKSNTAYIYMNDTVFSRSATGSLIPTSQEAAPQAGSVKLVKFDEASNQPIPGMKFTLERWDGSAWAPYKTTDGDSAWTTGNNGSLQVDNIVSGTYRLVEDNTVAFNLGYDTEKIKFYSDAALTSEITQFTVNTSSTEGVLLYASNKKLVKYTEKYYYHDMTELPYQVRATLPTRAGEYFNGDIVTAENPSAAMVTVGDVRYEFLGWERNPDTIKNADARFIGRWESTVLTTDPCKVPVNSITQGAHTDATCTPMTAGGVTYPVVLVNGHCWTKENLRTATPNSMVYSTSMNHADETTFGRLYTHGEAATICPSGWHLPTADEAAALATYDAWGLMAEGNWIAAATDESGFAAQPAGFYNHTTRRFEGMRGFAGFLTAEQGEIFAIHYHCCSASLERADTRNAYSVRCVKN